MQKMAARKDCGHDRFPVTFRLGPFPIPRQHGAWAVFLIPTFMALVVARPWQWSSLILVVAYVLVFLSHRPAGKVIRGRGSRRGVDSSSLAWTVILGGSGAAIAAVVLAVHPVWSAFGLALLAAATYGLHLQLTLNRKHMSIPGEMVGIFGLTAAGPLTYVFVQRTLDEVGWFLWLLNFLYFGGSVFYVKLKLRAQPSLPKPFVRERIRTGFPSLMWVVFVLVMVSTTMIVAKGFSWLFIAAYIPFMAKVFTGVFRWQDKGSLNVKRFGFTELAHSVIFFLLATWGFHVTAG